MTLLDRNTVQKTLTLMSATKEAQIEPQIQRESVWKVLTVRGKTDRYAGSVGTKVFECLLVRGTSGRCDDCGVRSEAIWNGSLDGLDDILLVLEVDPFVGTELLHKLLLLGTSVDSNDAESHV